MGLSNETAFALSSQRETALNTNYTVLAEFEGIVPDNPGAIFPEMEKSDNVGRAGREFANQICNLYWTPPGLSLPLRVNFLDVGKLLLRHLGGDVTTTVAGRTGGTKQVETATVAGTITATGTVKVTITAAGMSGSPLDVFVDVLDTDSAATVAGKIRTALQAHSIVGDASTGFFTVTGATTAVILTVNVPAANDATLNIATDNGTATGLTAAPTSANTTAGVAGTAAAWKHTTLMLPKASGYQLPSSDVVVQNEGDDFLFAGMVGNQVTLAQESTNLPIATFDLVGTGKHVNPAGFTAPTATSDVDCLDGAASQILYTDDADDTFDLYETGDVRSWSVVLANNLITEPARTRSGGDPLIGPTGGTARHIQKLKRGNRTATAQIVVVFGDTIPWWIAMAKNTEFTDFAFKVNGPLVGGVAQSLAIIFPLCTVRATPGTDSNGDAAYTLNITALEDPVTLGGATAFVINEIENGVGTEYN